MYRVMSSADSDSLTSLPIWMPLIYFFCLIAVARTASTTLNKSGDSRCPYCIPDFRGKTLEFFIIVDNVSCGVFICGLYCIEEYSL